MFEPIHILFIGAIICLLFIRKKMFIYFLLNKGVILSIDDGSARVMKDAEIGVSARADRITRYKKKKYLVEFKSRKKGIYEKDIIQSYVGALASWDKVDGLDAIVVYNGSYQYRVLRLRSKKATHGKVVKFIDKAQSIKAGRPPKGRVNKIKCRVCPYKVSCKKSKLH